MIHCVKYYSYENLVNKKRKDLLYRVMNYITKSIYLCFFILLIIRIANSQSSLPLTNQIQKVLEVSNEPDDDGKPRLLRFENSHHNWKSVDTLISIDSYFNIDNHGLTQILVELNGYLFRLTTEPVVLAQGDNIFLMPKEGKMTIDISNYLNPYPELTIIRLNWRGPLGTSADIIIGDQIIGGGVNIVLILVELPQVFEISQNYPNPFNNVTNITYKIPDDWLDGLLVNLTIYNIRGQKIQTLVNDRRFPGSFTEQWNGRNDQGDLVGSGLFLYRIQVGNQQAVRRMLLVK